MNGISKNKMNHILGVARECKKLAEEKGLPEDMQNACFVMGFLHDIGYEKCNRATTTTHPQHSYAMICDFEKYKYEILQAIRAHGNKYDNLSVFDEILNTADLTTDYKGDKTSIEQRIESIKHVHGENSMHYKHAYNQAETIRKIQKG